MLQLVSFTFNPFSENTYVLFNEHRQCWIIDPGMMNEAEYAVLDNFFSANGLQPRCIINTHAHIDHILGVDYLAEKYAIPFLLHEKELPILNNAGNTARMFGFQYEGVRTTPGFIREQEPLQLGDDQLEVRFVPGHSPGSIAFYYPQGNWVISGDTLFSGSIGRTDLLMGDYPTLIQSIKNQLLSLPDDTEVFSGHGPSTTVGMERNSNPFIQD